MRNLSMNIIRWCNENNGFLTAILSLIGLVLSVTAIVVSIRTARLPYKKKLMLGSYTKLQLKYLKGSNSAFVDGAGELVCFESSELIGNDTGFYIRYDKLLEFLKSSSYTLVWTSLCEKRILTPSFGRWDLPPKAIHMSSVYYLKDGKIAKASETLFEDRLYY